MDDDICSGSICFHFRTTKISASQYVVYGCPTTIDNSLSLNPNQCHYPLITQLRQQSIFHHGNFNNATIRECEFILNMSLLPSKETRTLLGEWHSKKYVSGIQKHASPPCCAPNQLKINNKTLTFLQKEEFLPSLSFLM